MISSRGSLPRILRGNLATRCRGRGRKAASIRWRSAGEDIFGTHAGRDSEGREPVDGIADIIGGDKDAVQHTFDRIQMVVQMRQRRAFASNVDQVGDAAVQRKSLGLVQLDDVGQQRFFRDRDAGSPGTGLHPDAT